MRPISDYPPEESGKEYRAGNGAGNPAGRIRTGSQKGTRVREPGQLSGQDFRRYWGACRVRAAALGVNDPEGNQGREPGQKGSTPEGRKEGYRMSRKIKQEKFYSKNTAITVITRY
jgi:hypothetical protein